MLSQNIQQSRPQQQPLARFEITYFTEDNAGTYTCIAENSFGETAVERFVVNARREERGPPTITVDPKRVEAYEGSSVIVNYTYTGSEPVHIKVDQYSAQPQSNSNIYVNKAGKKIDISRISKDMQGQYVVEATNDYGTSSDYFELVVNDGMSLSSYPFSPLLYLSISKMFSKSFPCLSSNLDRF